MTKRPKRDPALVEVIAAIGAGNITLDSIHDDDEFVYGFCEGSKIVVNHVLPVVETAVHEVLHRLHWAWSERSVKAKTTRLMKQLTDAEIDRLYSVIMARQRKGARKK